MYMSTIEHVGLKVASLSAVIYASEKLDVLRSVISERDTPATAALKASAFLTGCEYVGDYVGSHFLPGSFAPPTLLSDLKEAGVSVLATAAAWYAMEKMELDDKIVSRGASQEMRAVQLAVLYVVAQYVANYALRMYFR